MISLSQAQRSTSEAKWCISDPGFPVASRQSTGPRTLRLRRQRLFDLRLQRRFQIAGADRPDQLERDAAVAADHESFRHAVDAPVDRGAAVCVGADRGKRIAVAADEAAGVLGFSPCS